MRAAGRHGAESSAGARVQMDGRARRPLGHHTPDTGPALRDRRGHNFPKRRGRAPSLLCESCWRRCQLQLGAAASAVSTAPRCKAAASPGLEQSPPGAGAATSGQSRGVPSFPPGCLRGECCGSAANPALTAGTGSRPARRRLPRRDRRSGGQSSSGGAGTGSSPGGREAALPARSRIRRARV